VGISPEDQKKIFDRFRQVGSSRKTKGFGLGLAICKEIIKRHQGKIWVESDVEKGSKFSFILPLDQRDYEEM
jgi:signal transduction histidine kinase